MTATDWVAIIGAAAWAPQIFQWIYSATKRPLLKVVSASTVELSYTLNGPTVVLTTAISAERKEALIKEIKLNVTHEKGERREFRWEWLKESAMQMNVPTGETLEFAKDQPALALKVSTLTLTEKRITFTDPNYCSAMSAALVKLWSHYEFLRRNNSQNPEEQAVKSQMFSEAQDMFVQNLYWREGEYTFEIALSVVGLKKAYREKLRVLLTRADVDVLKSNLVMSEQHIRAWLRHRNGVAVKWPGVRWASPQVVQSW